MDFGFLVAWGALLFQSFRGLHMASRAPGFGGARALEMVARAEEGPLGLLLLTAGVLGFGFFVVVGRFLELRGFRSLSSGFGLGPYDPMVAAFRGYDARYGVLAEYIPLERSRIPQPFKPPSPQVPKLWLNHPAPAYP